MSRTYRKGFWQERLRDSGHVRFPDGCPKWFRRVRTTKPRRQTNRQHCRKVVKGFNPDHLIWALGNRPQEYWW